MIPIPALKKHFIFLILLSILTINIQAADVKNGERINATCAFCHGMFGQGTPGILAPRLADLPEWYLQKSIQDFKKHTRMDSLMMKTTGMDKMTQKDIQDVSAYLSNIGLSQDKSFNIEMSKGNPKEGQKLFLDDCKSCHAKDGFGKERKDAPPLAGQHHEYLLSTIQMFKTKQRHHDNDPDDETFEDYAKEDLENIMSYVATLDNKKFKAGFRFTPPGVKHAATPKIGESDSLEDQPTMQIVDIRQTMAKIPLADSVTVDEAIIAMRSKAFDLNLRIVGEQHISKEQRSRGIEAHYLTVMQFCTPNESFKLVAANPIFAGYMPCRIAIVEDNTKKIWLLMFNLDMMVDSQLLPPQAVQAAVTINRQMLSIMAAGANGDF